MKVKMLRLLLLVMALVFAGVTESWAASKDEAAQCQTIPLQGPCRDSSDRLWGNDQPSCSQVALQPQSQRYVSSPRYDYEPVPQSHEHRLLSRIPDYAKFNPYNLITCSWLRRLLKASHPYARAGYYVYALRHIIR